MNRLFFFWLVLVLTGKIVDAQPVSDNLSTAIRVLPENIVWSDAKPPVPPGAKAAVLEGDPKSNGIFTIRMKLPAHYTIPPHTHPRDERVTVISGSIFMGLGDSLDQTKAVKYP